MCRRDQQEKALAALGLPKNAMQQVEELKGTRPAASVIEDPSPSAPTPSQSRAMPPLPSTATAPQPPTTNTQSYGTRRNDDSDRSSQAMDFDPRPRAGPRSGAVSAMQADVAAPQPFWAEFDHNALDAVNAPPQRADEATGSERPASDAFGPSTSTPEPLLRFNRLNDVELPSSDPVAASASTIHIRRWSNPGFDRFGPVTADMAPEIRGPRDFILTGEEPLSDRFSARPLDSSHVLRPPRHSEPDLGMVASREPAWVTSTAIPQVIYPHLRVLDHACIRYSY
jgi:hypothetical protein